MRKNRLRPRRLGLFQSVQCTLHHLQMNNNETTEQGLKMSMTLTPPSPRSRIAAAIPAAETVEHAADILQRSEKTIGE